MLKFKILSRIIPNSAYKQLANFKILSKGLGQYNSIKSQTPVDSNNKPLPWYTYPFLEYIKQFDYRSKLIFEWGSGNSSLFWAKEAKKVTSVENNQDWYNEVKKNINANQDLIFAQSESKYINSIRSGQFDIIIIDGSYRLKCAEIAPEFLNENGIIIVDNSDWFPKACNILKSNGFFQIDFIGFGPINNYTWSTSIFFKSSINLKRKTDKMNFVGGLDRTYDNVI